MVQVQLGVMLGASGEFGKEDGRRQFVATLREMKTGLTSAAHDGSKRGGLQPLAARRKIPRHPPPSNRNRPVRRDLRWTLAVVPNWERRPSLWSRKKEVKIFFKARSAMAPRSSSSFERPAATIHRPGVPIARLTKSQLRPPSTP